MNFFGHLAGKWPKYLAGFSSDVEIAFFENTLFWTFQKERLRCHASLNRLLLFCKFKNDYRDIFLKEKYKIQNTKYKIQKIQNTK